MNLILRCGLLTSHDEYINISKDWTAPHSGIVCVKIILFMKKHTKTSEEVSVG